MQNVDLSGLDALDARFAEALRLWPSLKKETLEAAGAAMRDMVRWNAASSGMKNDGGPVTGWQRYYVGTKRGYVAVRAAGGRDGGGTEPGSAGAITNYTENGHATRRPAAVKRDGYRYRPRINVAGVRGYHYYAASEEAARQEAARAVADLCEEGAGLIGGEAE